MFHVVYSFPQDGRGPAKGKKKSHFIDGRTRGHEKKIRMRHSTAPHYLFAEKPPALALRLAVRRSLLPPAGPAVSPAHCVDNQSVLGAQSE
ncbi:hypothetical protein E2C01_040150 [Portunus trituberculatus]|uniref:Uncharacterized protein n=1 Tax=Portunus trituberculatus TaxID=210409 RepID=A0A5B7FFP7_PORTR|nr:hypothetical protein [Portunus trituberculatus]